MNLELYKEFIKVFANIVASNDERIADMVDYDYDSPLYQYYHSHYKCDDYKSEDAMWRNFWADFEEAFDTFFKNYI